MSAGDSRHLTDLLREALALDAAGRASLLERLGREAPLLRDRLAEMLQRQDSATIVGASSAGGSIGTSTPVSVAEGSNEGGASHPRRIGSYTVLKVLGEGGMGVVYLARQENPDRLIALKVVRPGLLTPRMLRRFDLEAQVLGRLHHPGIAQIYQAGTADAGSGPQPFFAMEYVKGVPLTAFAGANSLSVRQRIDLFTRVCEAVHHAHQKGVIHRDLKPGNILVVDELSADGRDSAQPKILDFGIARATDSDMQTATLQTEVGQIVGTLPYMSPEQIAGDPADLDTRSDVYTLGVILYELLAGRLPHALSNKTIPEAVRIIGQEEPVALGAADSRLRGDLQTIVAKAMEKDKIRRYQSAAELAADLLHYLRDEPITARPPSTVYQLTKFARRHRGLVAGIAAAFGVLVLGAAATAWQAVRATQGWVAAEKATILANEEAANAKATNDFLINMLTAADPDQDNDRELTVREMVDRAAESLATSPPASPRVRLSLLGAMSSTYKGVGRSAQALPHARAAYELAEKEFGPEHPDTIEAMRAVAITLNDLAKFDESEPLIRRAVEVSKRRFGAESGETAKALGDLAALQFQQGKLAEAEVTLREALRIGTATLGERHRDVLTNMDHLGAVLSSLGRFADAEIELRRVLALRTEVYGPEHPITAYTINTLANTIQKQGRGPEAIELLTRALEIRRKKLDPEHPSLVVTIQNLAVALIGEKQYDRAEPLLREALAIQVKRLGPAHPRTLLMTGNLAYLLEDVGRLEEAESTYRSIIETRRKAGLMNDAETYPQMNNLAMLLQRRGKLDEAEAMYKETIALCARNLPADHYFTGIFRNNYGDLLVDLHRYDDAEKELLESHAAVEKFFGPRHARTKKSLGRLVRLYESWGRADSAERYRTVLAGR